MAKLIMTKEELQAWITAEIQKSKGCEECVASGVVPLAEPDESGCNWSDRVVLSTAGVPRAVFIPVVREVLIRARSGINLNSASPQTCQSSGICMQRRELYTPVFHIDTNRINSRAKLPMMNQIEKWAKEGVILTNMSGTSFQEALQGGDTLCDLSQSHWPNVRVVLRPQPARWLRNERGSSW